MNQHKSLFPTVGLAAVTIIMFDTAQGAGTEPPLEIEPRMVVTASRSSQELAEAAGAISVISREDIHRSVAEDLTELLRLQAGIDIVRTGGAGAQTSIFLRGTNSNHVLVLIDGIRVASNHTGAFAWEQLPLNQVERIEIVRGPRASLYGSDAIGGVIQVFTRKSSGPYVRVTGGSYSTAEIEAGTAYEDQNYRLGVNAAMRHSGGFSSQNTSGYSYHPDDDGLDAANISINGAANLGHGELSYLLLASRNETEFDQGSSESRHVVAGVTWSGRFKPDWDYQLKLSLNDETLDSDYIFFTSGFESDRIELNWQNRLLFDRGALGFGVELDDNSGESADSYRESRNNTGLYAHWEQAMERHDLQLSGRLDDNSEFGSEFTWQMAFGTDIGNAGRLTALAGSAFRTPSLSEQFSPGFGGLFAGNPALAPESSRSLELAYRRELGAGGELSLSAYRTQIDDLIAYSGENFGAVNVNKAEISGLELEYSLSAGQWMLNAGLTLQDTEDRASGTSLLRRPDEKASIALDRKFGNGAWAGFDWFVSGHRLDVGGLELPGYGVFSLRGGMPLSADFSFELRLENLFNADYEPASGFNSAGRSGFVSLNWRP